MRKWTPALETQLKERITQLHDHGSSDFTGLMRQAGRRVVEVNVPQAYASLAPQSFVFLEWGRGTGKTTELARQVYDCVVRMPRSTGLFIVPNYQVGLSHIIPSLVKGLEMFGLYQGLHFFIGERPPRRWRKYWGRAYEPPREYKRYITFWNGTGMHLISHDKSDDGRGINSDWIIGDEAALLNPALLQQNTDPTRRGTNQNVFGACPLLGLRKYVSSTPITPEGRWMLEYEQKAVENPTELFYHRATCQYNLHNLRPGYLKEAEETALSHWVFEAEYKGIRPKFTMNSFYPLFDSDRHCYRSLTIDDDQYLKAEDYDDCRGDRDLVAGVPLILGVDWGAAINCLTVNQLLRSRNEYRTLNAMYVLGDKQEIQDDLLKKLHDYYLPHQSSCNILHLYFDNTGNNRTGHTRQTRAEQARAQLQKLGWRVQLMTTGSTNPRHEAKHILWNAVLREEDRRLPRYRMNFYRTEALRASIGNAKVKKGRNGEVKKDKSSEQRKGIPRQFATDLSDANDAALYGLFATTLRYVGDPLPAPRARSGR